MSPEQPQSTLPPSVGGGGPFAGLRVIELSSTVAGPFCGRLLADFGAEVIKVEPAEGDPVRWMGLRADNKSLYAASIFRNKKLVALDLRRSDAQEAVRRITAACDILVENFRPGSMEKWGLCYDRLSAANPGLIMVRISGYGQDGPYADRPGYGVTCEAMSGMREITGDPDRPPARVAVSLTDYITGLYAAFGAAMAVHQRHLTGRGQVIDAALYESAFSFMEPHIPAFSKLGVVARRAGSRLPNHTPNNLYPTGDGRYIHITAGSQPIFKRLCEAMAQSTLVNDPRFATPAARSTNEDAIDGLIRAWTATKPLTELESILGKEEVPASRIYTVADIFADPQYRARNMLVEVDDPDLGSLTVPGIVPKMSATPGAIRWGGRRIGEDTVDVLRGVAGLTDSEIERLRSNGAIFVPPATTRTTAA